MYSSNDADSDASASNNKSAKSIILNYSLMILAGYLCYNCNKNENIIIRILYFIIAIIFSPYYIIYYVTYHYVFKEPCNKSFIKAGIPTRLI